MMRLILAIGLMSLLHFPAWAGERIILQSTTSTQNSGLLDEILPLFTEATGIDVAVVAVGTGQALRNARNGDGDVVLVHARTLEDQFVLEGWGVDRRDLMYNDFVIVGPSSDPAGIKGMEDPRIALIAIANGQHTFLSRGDDSGTHVKERTLWNSTQLNTTEASGTWYRETGSGMGTTLNIAVELNGYTLTDRGTWISFGNKRNHEILVQNGPELFNPYGIMRVNPDRHAHVDAQAGLALLDWLTGPIGQAAISNYRLEGEQLFFPSAQ